MKLVSVALGVLVGACGSSHGTSIDATPDSPPDAPPDAAFAEAPHPAAPQAQSGGGPVQTAPVIQPIFFAGDSAMQTQVEGFLGALATSEYWHTATAEYGVGGLTILPTIVVTEAAPTSDTALQAFLRSHADGTHAGWPTPSVNTNFAVYTPAGVSVSTPFGTSCQAFGGYHDETTTTTGGPLVYSLLPRCDPSLDSLTIVTSHELVEAATDPLPFTQPAYQNTDTEHAIWMFVPGGELGDMCEYVAAAAQQLVGSYYVQRTWSNASAAGGHDPCVPALTTPYLTAAPVLAEDVSIDLGPPQGTLTTKGITVPLGMSKTVEVDLFSDAPSADWTVKAFDAAPLAGNPNELTVALDKTSGHNGDKLMLTITRLRAPAMGGASEFVLSSRVNNMSVSLWWGFAAQ
jgi:hypothetical protein